MRSEQFLKNLISGFAGQGINILLKFISRTVFIYVLGKEFLGISSLFTNILTVLNLTELGLGNAIIYNLYKPIAQKDTIAVQANINFLEKAYRVIGSLVLITGLALTFSLPYIINGTTDLVNVRLYFILYVLQSVSSYWFWAYKRLLLQADQKNYVVNIITYFSSTVSTLIQMACLLLFKSFLLYTILGILSNVATNYLIAKKVDQLYPFIKNKNDSKLSKADRQGMLKNVVGISLYKVNSVIVRSTDNIVISLFINTVSVGLYDNYHLITSSLLAITKMIFSSATAGIGNMNVTETVEKKEDVFQCICFFCFWIYGACGICLWILLNTFIVLWLDASFLLSTAIVALIVLDFIMDGYQNPSLIYKDGCGLFWQGKFRPLATAVLNLMISVILAPRIGIAGVIAGTIVSRFLTTWWFEPWLVYKHVFKKSARGYFVKYGMAICLTVLLGGGVTYLCSYFQEATLSHFIIRMGLSLVIPNGIVMLLFYKTKEFRYAKNIFIGIIVRRKQEGRHKKCSCEE